MRSDLDFQLPDDAATQALGEKLAGLIGKDGLVVFLHGDLGSGKTTLVRSTIQALGFRGRVRSPTYTLMEHYALQNRPDVIHIDLYRLQGAGEVHELGLDDIDLQHTVVMIEWPEQANGELPPVDIRVMLSYDHTGGRHCQVSAGSERGMHIVDALSRNEHTGTF